MADKKTQNPNPNPKPQKQVQTQVPGKVISMDDYRCKSEGCKAKSTKAQFCGEHFEWFKAGLITKDGARAQDFEKKYYQYIASHPQKKVA